ncbi:MAG: glucose-1-phosphate adenylyltransferase subunit GlgD [Peptostreptococcaceae bacterium]|nr:glucose-1-phosphate adenylyltransferase subunit GlgD [Peptostreptococcaceae bacterium]
MKNITGIISADYLVSSLKTLTKDRGIAALPFGSKYRMIDFPLSNMANSGIVLVGLIVPSNFGLLVEHVGIGKEWNLDKKTGGIFILPGSSIDYRNPEGKFLLNDLKQNQNFTDSITDKYILISATSKVFNINYRDVLKSHIDNNSEITLVYKESFSEFCKSDYSAEMDSSGRIIHLDTSSDNSNNCILDTILINTDIFQKLVQNYDGYEYLDLMKIIADNTLKYKVYGYEFKGYVAVFNNIESYLTANQGLLNDEVRNGIFNLTRPISTKMYDIPPTKYTKSAEISNSLVATGSTIKGSIKNSIIFRNVLIEEGSKVENALIMQNCTINKNSKLKNAIMDEHSSLSENTEVIGDEASPMLIDKNKHL